MENNNAYLMRPIIGQTYSRNQQIQRYRNTKSQLFFNNKSFYTSIEKQKKIQNQKQKLREDQNIITSVSRVNRNTVGNHYHKKDAISLSSSLSLKKGLKLNYLEGCNNFNSPHNSYSSRNSIQSSCNSNNISYNNRLNHNSFDISFRMSQNNFTENSLNYGNNLTRQSFSLYGSNLKIQKSKSKQKIHLSKQFLSKSRHSVSNQKNSLNNFKQIHNKQVLIQNQKNSIGKSVYPTEMKISINPSFQYHQNHHNRQIYLQKYQQQASLPHSNLAHVNSDRILKFEDHRGALRFNKNDNTNSISQEKLNIFSNTHFLSNNYFNQNSIQIQKPFNICQNFAIKPFIPQQQNNAQKRNNPINIAAIKQKSLKTNSQQLNKNQIIIKKISNQKQIQKSNQKKNSKLSQPSHLYQNQTNPKLSGAVSTQVDMINSQQKPFTFDQIVPLNQNNRNQSKSSDNSPSIPKKKGFLNRKITVISIDDNQPSQDSIVVQFDKQENGNAEKSIDSPLSAFHKITHIFS